MEEEGEGKGLNYWKDNFSIQAQQKKEQDKLKKAQPKWQAHLKAGEEAARQERAEYEARVAANNAASKKEADEKKAEKEAQKQKMLDVVHRRGEFYRPPINEEFQKGFGIYTEEGKEKRRQDHKRKEREEEDKKRRLDKYTPCLAGEAKSVKDRIIDAFQKYDSNGDGLISKEELSRVLCQLGMEQDWVDALFEAADVNHDGSLSYEEFVQFVMGENDDEYTQYPFLYLTGPMGMTWNDWIRGDLEGGIPLLSWPAEDGDDEAKECIGGRIGACLTAAVVWEELLQLPSKDVVEWLSYYYEDAWKESDAKYAWSSHAQVHTQRCRSRLGTASMQVIDRCPFLLLGTAEANDNRITLTGASKRGQGSASLYKLLSASEAKDLQIKFRCQLSDTIWVVLSDASHPEWFCNIGRGEISKETGSAVFPGALLCIGMDRYGAFTDKDDGFGSVALKYGIGEVFQNQACFCDERSGTGVGFTNKTVGTVKIRINGGCVWVKINKELVVDCASHGDIQSDGAYSAKNKADITQLGLSFLASSVDDDKDAQLAHEIWDVRIDDEFVWDDDTDEAD